jgi:adenylate cyclase
MGVTALATSLFLEGNLAESHATFAGALTRRPGREEHAATAGFGVDSATLFHAQLSRALACLGFAAEAEAQAEAALSRARLMHHMPSVAISLSATCTTAWVLRDLQTLEERSSALVRLAEEQGFSFWEARGRCYSGWVAAQHGRLDEAFGLLAAGIASLRSSGVTLYVPAAYVMMADVHQLRRDQAAANDALDDASSLAARTGERWCEAEMLCCQGTLQRDNPAAAEALLQRALDVARRQSAKTFELRAALALSRLRTAQGRPAEAGTLLAPICDWFTGKRGAHDLNEARALLATL